MDPRRKDPGGGSGDHAHTVELLDAIADYSGRSATRWLARVDAGKARPIGDVDTLRAALEEMRDRGIEARALPGRAERRRSYRDAIARVSVAQAAAIGGAGNDVHRELDALAFENMLDNDAPEWSEDDDA